MSKEILNNNNTEKSIVRSFLEGWENNVVAGIIDGELIIRDSDLEKVRKRNNK